MAASADLYVCWYNGSGGIGALVPVPHPAGGRAASACPHLCLFRNPVATMAGAVLFDGSMGPERRGGVFFFFASPYGEYFVSGGNRIIVA